MESGCGSFPRTSSSYAVPGRLHGSQGRTFHLRREEAFADQPAGFRGGLLPDILLHQGAEDVGHGFVDGAGLVPVGQPGRVLGDAVGQFMADHAERPGEAFEDFAVAVAEDHLLAVPERVVVELAEMDRGVEGQSPAVDGIPAEDVGVQAVRVAQAVVGLVSGRIAGGCLAFLADEMAGERLAALGVVDGSVDRARPQLPHARGSLGRGGSAGRLDGPDVAQGFLGGPGNSREPGRILGGEASQHVRRND